MERDEPRHRVPAGRHHFVAVEARFDLRVEPRDAATIGGLVSAIAGRIPRPGEVIEDDGLRFEVLESTDRRVEKVRVKKSGHRVTGSSGHRDS